MVKVTFRFLGKISADMLMRSMVPKCKRISKITARRVLTTAERGRDGLEVKNLVFDILDLEGMDGPILPRAFCDTSVAFGVCAFRGSSHFPL